MLEKQENVRGKPPRTHNNIGHSNLHSPRTYRIIYNLSERRNRLIFNMSATEAEEGVVEQLKQGVDMVSCCALYDTLFLSYTLPLPLPLSNEAC